jgi:uncharacterized protein (DUF427 family)
MRRSPQSRRPGPGQESVWDYPRPPALAQSDARIEVELAGTLIASSQRAWRVLETSHPPVYYLPPADVRLDLLEASPKRSFCEWKGRASYHHVVVGARRAENAAWSYPSPVSRFEPIRDYLAFYPSAMDRCRVDGEVVRAQEGDFYGGWITSRIVGPFKGGPGSLGW